MNTLNTYKNTHTHTHTHTHIYIYIPIADIYIHITIYTNKELSHRKLLGNVLKCI